MLLFILAFLSGAVFTGGLVAYRVCQQRSLARVESMLREWGSTLQESEDPQMELVTDRLRLRVFEQYMDGLEDG